MLIIATIFILNRKIFMKSLLLYTLLSLSFLLGGGCKKSDHQADTFFPNEIGCQWTYAVFDSTRSASQTVLVKVIRTSKLSNGQHVSVWSYQYPDRIETRYVSVQRDTVRFFNQLDVRTTYENVLYILPLTQGKSWGVSSDSSWVTTQSLINLPAGSYQAWNVKRERFSYNFRISENSWVASQVGIVKLHRFSYDDGKVENTTWELTNYKRGN
jgi:hypothetical protein